MNCPAREFGRVALGEIDQRVNIRRLTLQPRPQDELVLSRRAVHEHAVTVRPMRAFWASRDDSLLELHQAVLPRRSSSPR